MNNILTADERFEYAMNLVFTHEGGYINDSSDKGGETKYGISKRSYPNIEIASITKEMAKAIYRRDFWEKERYNNIKDIALAAKIFDISVNIGSHWANRLLQRALRAIGKQNIAEDGILGSVSLVAVNASDPLALIAALRSETAGYYRTLAAVKQNQNRFLKGWLNRTYA